MKYWFIALWQMLHWPVRKTIRNKTITNKTLVLDFLKIDGCEVVGCHIVYMGLGPTHLNNGTFQHCSYLFAGPAGKALGLLKLMGAISPDLIYATFPFLKGVKKPL